MTKRNVGIQSFIVIVVASASLVFAGGADKNIPLPEHPRPDFHRQQWINLNGQWAFEFDQDNEGIEEKWYEPKVEFAKTIAVPVGIEVVRR